MCSPFYRLCTRGVATGLNQRPRAMPFQAKDTLDEILWPLIARKLDRLGRALDGQARTGMEAQPPLPVSSFFCTVAP